MMEEQINQTIDQLVFFLMFQKYMKDTFIATLIRIFFSQYQCGFRKGFSTQHALLVLIEKMKNACDNKKFYANILTDLSKVLIVSVMIFSSQNYTLMVPIEMY